MAIRLINSNQLCLTKARSGLFFSFFDVKLVAIKIVSQKCSSRSRCLLIVATLVFLLVAAAAAYFGMQWYQSINTTNDATHNPSPSSMASIVPGADAGAGAGDGDQHLPTAHHRNRAVVVAVAVAVAVVGVAVPPPRRRKPPPTLATVLLVCTAAPVHPWSVATITNEVPARWGTWVAPINPVPT